MSATQTAQAVRGICTPAQHANTSKAKPIKLLELGTGPHGKTATFEFAEGWQRTLDMPIEADAWHPIFEALPQEERFRLIGHTEAPFISHADGTQSRPSPLSFTRRICTARGKLLRFTYFDVPAQSYEEGNITGLKCAAELMEELSRGYGAHLMPSCIVEAAALASSGDYEGKNQCGAANSFLRVVSQALEYFAKHANHRPYIEELLASAERSREYIAQRNKTESLQFIERMKAGKAKKKCGVV